MKTVALIFAVIISLPSAYAQEDSVVMGKKFKFDIEAFEMSPNKSRTSWSGEFSMGLNQMVNENMELSAGMAEAAYWPSLATSLGLVVANTRIGGNRSPLHLKYGLYWNWHAFRLTDNNTLNKVMNADEEQVTVFGPSDIASAEQMRASSFTVVYFDVPVMLNLEINKNGKNNFMLAAGGYGGVRSAARTRQRFDDLADQRTRVRTSSDYNLNRFRYGLMAQLGFRDVILTYRLDLNPMFNDNNPINYQISTLSIGVILD